MKWRILVVLSIAELLGMALWFSASAVTPTLAAEWHLSDAGKAWLTMSVQIGFVVGAFLSALLNLSDIFSARYVFFVGAFIGAILNAAIGLYVNSLGPAIILRFFTGACLAGVYPPAMKIMASWFKNGRGMAIGILVGALTVGSASPHLLKIIGNPDWRELMLTSSSLSVIAGFICLFFVKDGPYFTSAARFDWRYIGKTFTDQGVRLANFGYLGHMWELYAVWTWIPLFLFESFKKGGIEDSTAYSAIGSFAVIGVGGLGCVVAGILADCYGRTRITIISMAISGSCCLLVGFLFGYSPVALIILCLIWGFAVPADSAQFSASVTELGHPDYIGTALTMQTCMGFLLTMVSIRLLPAFVNWMSWHWAFSVLAIGPLFGIWSMYRLRQSQAAIKIGGESSSKLGAYK
jgi:MFS family permease